MSNVTPETPTINRRRAPTPYCVELHDYEPDTEGDVDDGRWVTLAEFADVLEVDGWGVTLDHFRDDVLVWCPAWALDREPDGSLLIDLNAAIIAYDHWAAALGQADALGYQSASVRNADAA